MLWQFVSSRSDLALRASTTLLYTERPVTLLAPEMELIAPGGSTAIEIDLLVLRGRQLWIGEAKAASTLGSETAARTQLNKLRRAAQLVRANGILLVSGTPQGFSAATCTLIRERLGDLDVTLRLEALS